MRNQDLARRVAASPGVQRAVDNLQRVADESGLSMTFSSDGHEGATITPRGEKGAPMAQTARDARTEQLTLELGIRSPDVASFKVSGALGSLDQELMMGRRVTVTIADADGQVVAAGEGHVKSVGFKAHEATAHAPGFLERVHSIKLDG